MSSSTSSSTSSSVAKGRNTSTVSSSSTSNIDKLPIFQVLVLCIVNYNEAVQGNIIWPFLPFAVQRWGIAPDDTGTYVGILASSFFLAQLLFVAIWGKLADKFGRRPILLIGLLGTAISQTLFGIAKNYNIALLARFLTGALNGNVAIAKVYMGEITTKTTQAAGFAWIAFTWGFGSVTAPAIGGWLADPAAQYPDSDIGKIPLLIEYPYFLPAAVSIGVSLLSFLLGIYFLPETEAWKKTQNILSQQQQQQTKHTDNTIKNNIKQNKKPSLEKKTNEELSSSETNTKDNISTSTLPPIQIPNKHSSSSSTTSVPKHPRNIKAKSYVIFDKVHTPTQGTNMHNRRTIVGEEDYSTAFGENILQKDTTTTKPANISTSSRNAEKSDQENEENDDDEMAGLISGTPSKQKDTLPSTSVTAIPSLTTKSKAVAKSSSSTSGLTAPRLPHNAGIREIVKDRAVMTAVLNYGVLAFCQILFDELLPVFAKTVPEQGGLGWSSGDVGSLQMMQGATQIIVNLFLFPYLTRRFGLIHCFRYAMFPLVPYMIIFPAFSRVHFNIPLLWIIMMSAVIFKAGFMTTAFTSIMLLINNSSRGVSLGAINGVAQSVASFVRAVGPTLGGALYSASVKADFLGDFRLHIVYTLMGILAFITYLTSYTMPEWCNEAPDILGTLDNDHVLQQQKGPKEGKDVVIRVDDAEEDWIDEEDDDIELMLDDDYDDTATLNEVDSEEDSEEEIKQKNMNSKTEKGDTDDELEEAAGTQHQKPQRIVRK